MTNERTNYEYDVFHSFLVKGSDYDGYYELPCIKTSSKTPNKLISFSKAMGKNMTDFNQWVMFYEDDAKFERLWANPSKYLGKLKKFNGIISPDFSLYRNMPLCFQLWNTYRGRALAAWLQANGIEIIPNVRWNDERTFTFAFNGIEKSKTIAVSTHGCIKRREDRNYFKKGLDIAIKYLKPENIIVYGSAPDDIFNICKEEDIRIIPFESEFSISRRQVNA